MRSFMHRIVCAVVFSFAAMQSFSYGQEIKDEKLVRGGIDTPNKIQSFTVDLPNKVEVLNSMQDRMLTPQEQRQLAIDAMALRSSNSDVVYEDCTIEDVLTATRKEDEGDSLWLVFNRIQESIINGGYSAALGGAKVRKVRAIKSFEKNIKVNQDLFKLAVALLN